MRLYFLDRRRHIIHSSTWSSDGMTTVYATDCGQRFNNPKDVQQVDGVTTCLWCAAGTFIK